MSRRDRRAALARGKAEPAANLAELAARATLAFQEGRAIDAEVHCDPERSECEETGV